MTEISHTQRKIPSQNGQTEEIYNIDNSSYCAVDVGCLLFRN